MVEHKHSLYFRMPHKCHGNGNKCPTRSQPIWELPINELDRREDPSFDERLSGCHLVSSCSNVYDPAQFRTLLEHNFNRYGLIRLTADLLNWYGLFLPVPNEARRPMDHNCPSCCNNLLEASRYKMTMAMWRIGNWGHWFQIWGKIWPLRLFVGRCGLRSHQKCL